MRIILLFIALVAIMGFATPQTSVDDGKVIKTKTVKIDVTQ